MPRLTGPQMKQLLDALLEAFDRPALGELLLFRLNRDIDQLASADDDLREVTTKIIKRASQEGWIADFLRAVAAERPNLPDLQAFVASLLAHLEAPPPAPRQAIEQKPGASPVIRPRMRVIREPFELQLMHVPAGPFLMGSDPARDELCDTEKELPQHEVTVAEYYVGRYEVTNAQYAAFVRATGRAAPNHWQQGQVPAGLERHPVVYVSWHDAMAFTEWLSAQTGKRFRLPTEAEWEKAARGIDGRIYPWGDAPGPLRANFANIRGYVTPVGDFSESGDSPYGASDMIGNVYEWTTSLIAAKYPYDGEDGRENLKAQGPRVMRGVSFHSNARDARCAFRRGYPSDSKDPGVGFRVVLHA